MPKLKSNYTLVSISRGSKSYWETHPEDAFPEIVANNGKIGKKDEAQRAYLVRGSDDMVLAQWPADPLIFRGALKAIPEIKTNINTSSEPMRPSDPEDPVARIKREAKARIAPADATKHEPPNFPEPEDDDL